MSALEADLSATLDAAVASDVPDEVVGWVAEGCQPSFDLHDHNTLPDRAGRWTIGEDGAASWAMRKAGEAQAELDTVDALYDRQKKALDKWREQATRRPTRTLAFMSDRLKAYAIGRRDRDPAAKTLVLPGGTVTTRVEKRPWKVQVLDRRALLAWAVETKADQLLRQALRPDAEVASALSVVEKEDGLRVYEPLSGALPPGVAAEPTRPSATVTPHVDGAP